MVSFSFIVCLISFSHIFALGLDPAGPKFTQPEIVDESKRLNPNDAQHVQCLHTNRGQLGTALPCGDSDYYSYFGRRQPGCSDDGCDHMRSVEIFESSMNPDHEFVATKYKTEVDAENSRDAEGTDRFGIHGKHSDGQFYFETSNCYPFAQLK